MTTINAVNMPQLTTNGQVHIGSTGAYPVASTLTAGAGISIVNGAGSITLSSSGGSMSWTTVSGTSQAIVAANGYVANNAGLVTFTLPSTAAVGDTFVILGLGAGGWSIVENTGQLIRFGNQVTTTTTGSLSSSNQYDSVLITCLVTNTTWTVREAVGNLTVV